MREALASTFERWNGKGQPNGVTGPPARIEATAHSQQRRAHLRLQQLAKRAVLPEHEHGDQLTQALLVPCVPPRTSSETAKTKGDQEFSRCPAACCGITGLKTSYGRVLVDGVWPLAPSLDTVGPMAATVGGLVTGMAVLEPGFAPAAAPARRIGRLRTAARPEIEQAVDEALKAAEFEVVTLDWDGLAVGTTIFTTICLSEVWDTDHALAQAHPDAVGDDIRQTLGMADLFRPGLVDARNQLAAWRQSLLDLFAQLELLALPTLPVFPPRLDDLTPDSLVNMITMITQYTGLFNAAGTPCTAQPVRAAGTRLPASLQFVGPPRGEELLLATACHVEAAAG